MAHAYNQATKAPHGMEPITSDFEKRVLILTTAIEIIGHLDSKTTSPENKKFYAEKGEQIADIVPNPQIRDLLMESVASYNEKYN